MEHFDGDTDLSWCVYDEHGFVVIEQLWAGAPTGAGLTFPMDAAPALAHAILDTWMEEAEDRA